MAVIAARRAAAPGFLYFEGEDYVLRTSRRQTSSLFAKRAPFVTGSYLDEIALAAALAAPAPLLMLGGSFGSTFALCRHTTPDARIISVDRDPEAARAGRHFCARVLDENQAAAIDWRTESAESLAPALAGEAGAVFVDLYAPAALDPYALDLQLHRAVAGVALINIFDPGYGAHADCATRAAIDQLSELYPSFVVARRRHSSVIIASHAPQAELRSRILDAQSRLAIAGVTAAALDEISGARSSRTDLFALGSQVATLDANGHTPEGDDLIDRATREVSALTIADIVALTRAPSSFLDF